MNKVVKLLSKLLCWLFLLTVLMFPLISVEGGSKTFIIKNDDNESCREQHRYMYFPTSTSPGTYLCRLCSTYINSASSLITKPYEIVAQYVCYMDSPSRDGVSSYPSLSISRCDSNGGIIAGSAIVIQQIGTTLTGNITMNPNEGLFFDFYIGKWYYYDFWKDRNYRAFTGYVQVTYQFDETAPNSPVLNLANENDTSHVKSINGVYYSSLNPTVIQWNNPGDPGTPTSGIITYKIYDNGIYITQVTADSNNPNNNTYLLTSEGSHKIQVQAIDYEGNASALSQPMNVIVDYTANQPTLPTRSIVATSKSQSDSSTNYDVVFNWDGVSDVTGIDHYEAALSQNSDKPYNSEISSVTTTQYTFSNIASSSTPYYAYVRAVDIVGNTSSWTKTGSIVLYYPSTSFGTITPHATIENGQPTYSVALPIQDVNADQYVIARRKASESTATPIATLSKTQLSAFGFTYTDTANLEKHGQFIYSIYTESDIGAISSTTYSETVTIPNIAAIVTAIDTKGQTIADNLAINEPTYGFNLSSTQDSEGDQLKFRVKCQTKDGSKTVYFPSDDALSGGPVIVSLSEGIWYYQLETAEFVNGAELSDNSYTRQTTAKKTLMVDLTAPPSSASSNNFTIQSKTGKILDAGNNPTNSRNIRISGITLTDNPGGSGIQGIYLWNGSLTTRPANAVHKDLADIPSALDWELEDGGDGIRAVTMEVVDNAGNTTLVTYQVLLDTTAPVAPDQNQLAHTTTAAQITFSWQADNTNGDVAGFQGTYTLPDGVIKSYTVVPGSNGALATGTLRVPVTGYGPNQPVSVTISSVDKAGNQSAPLTYSAYTKAALGNLQNLDGGYDAAMQQFFLSWQVSDTVASGAHQYSLEYGAVDRAAHTFTVLATLAPVSGIFTHGGLAAHGSYSYRLVAFNNSGDRSEGEIFTRQVPNTPPTAPELHSPLSFSRSKAAFTFAPSTDADGDNILYNLYLKAEGGQEYQEYLNVTGGYEADGLIHGKTYNWYIEAYDGYNTAKSNAGVFTVDTSVPALTVEAARYAYTNQRGLTITTSDGLSGIEKVSYTKISALDNTTIDSGTLNLTDNGNGTQSSGVISLSEGNYHLHFTAFDKAGNSTAVEVNNLKVDQTQPVLESVQLGLEQDGGRYLSSGELPVSLDGGDKDGNIQSGLSALRYWIVNDRGAQLGTGQTISLSPNLQHFSQTITLSGNNGEEYYLALALEDAAGNRSEVQYLGPIILDTSAPEAILTLAGLTGSGSSFYLADSNKLSATCIARDDQSGIAGTLFAILDAGSGEAFSPWGTWENVKKTQLTPGKSYQVAAHVTNKAGLVTEVKSEKFIYDNTAPQNLTLSGPTNPVASGEPMAFTANATESESSIVQYRLSIASTDGVIITTATDGNQDGWLVQSGNQFRFELPSATDGAYSVTVEAVNAAGLKSSATLSLNVSNSQEKVLVSDQGPYSGFGDKLTGWWKYIGSKTISNYQYRIVNSDGQALTDWTNTNDTQVTADNVKLESGKTYRFEVRVNFSDGSSLTGVSSGVTVDTTIPVINTLNTPAYSTSENLAFTWEASDSESGIAGTWVALGSSYYGTDITGGWVQVNGNSSSLTRDVNGKPLNLTNGKSYYLTLRVLNGAGLESEKAAPGVIINNAAPPTPLVTDQGDYINPTKQPLKANWIWTPSDVNGGKVTYQWALIPYGAGTAGATWTEVGQDTEVSLSDPDLPDGANYRFAVKATNQAGLSSTGYSDGIMIDKNAPVIPEVTLNQAINLGESQKATYITNANDLTLSINSYDLNGVTVYQYTYGAKSDISDSTDYNTSNTGTFPVNPTVSGEEVTVYKAVCSDGATNLSQAGYSSGVILDTGAPQITNVTGAVSGNTLIFNWDVVSSTSPVVSYEYALVPEARMNETPATWTSSALDRSIAIDGTNLADGKYRLLVRALNAAGTYSRRGNGEWGVSAGIILDRQAPVMDASALAYPIYVDNQITVTATASDNLSGIGGYQYALGTLNSPTLYSGGWIDVAGATGSVEFNVPTTSVPHNSLVYLMVRAKDNVGLWSTALVSQKILIDHTAPETPVLSYGSGSYSTSKTQVSGITFISSDPESALTHYRMGIVAAPGGEWQSIQEAPLEQFDNTLPYLNLTEGQVFRIAIQTCNGAGVWSAAGYSGAITVDTIAPELTFPQGETTLVLNTPPLTIGYTLSEAANVQFTLSAPDRTAEVSTISAAAGENSFIFNQSTPQTYTLTAEPKDLAGNLGTAKTQTIRVNAPPQITLTPLNTTPGAVVIFNAAVSDPDGHPVSYLWDPGDGGEDLSGVVATHSYAKTGTYTLTLRVTDNDGGVRVATTTVTVGNTASGTLYADETWSGTQYIYGDVTVPAGITLTVLPGTQVIVNGTADSGFTIDIKGSLNITDSGRTVSFVSSSGQAGSWKGIYLEGRATLDGVTVKDAERGLTVVSGSTASLSNCIFQNNQAGLHVYGTAPAVGGCAFLDNTLYGIKEDEGGRPVVKDCTFSGNGMDYYSEKDTDLTIDEVNQIPGNSGNK